ncbi:MAG: DedA family protein [Bacteroidota bacterium]
MAGTALAANGSLSAVGAALSAFLGTAIGEQVLFSMVRWKGQTFLDRWSAKVTVIERANRFIAEYGVLGVLFLRFMYGIRNPLLVMMAASRMNGRAFAVFNLLGAALWTIVYGAIGYSVGRLGKPLIRGSFLNEPLLVVVFGAVSLFLGAAFILHKRKAEKIVRPRRIKNRFFPE